jgi:hypothetical protein
LVAAKFVGVGDPTMRLHRKFLQSLSPAGRYSRPVNAPILATGSTALETFLGGLGEVAASCPQSDYKPRREVSPAKQASR